MFVITPVCRIHALAKVILIGKTTCLLVISGGFITNNQLCLGENKTKTKNSKPSKQPHATVSKCHQTPIRMPTHPVTPPLPPSHLCRADSPFQFRCSVCWKGFRHPMSLTLHRDMHSGKTKCPVCERAFSRVHDMRTHVQKKHFKMTMNFDSRATIVATTTTTTTLSRSEEGGGGGGGGSFAVPAATQTSNSPCGSSNRIASTETAAPAPSTSAAPPPAHSPNVVASIGRPEITVKLSHSSTADNDSSGEDELIIVTANKK